MSKHSHLIPIGSALIITMIAGAFILLNKPDISPSISPVQHMQTPGPTQLPRYDLITMESPDKNYTVRINPISDDQYTCEFKIIDKKNKEIPLRLIPSGQVSCIYGMGVTSSDFIRWTPDEQVIVNLPDGTLAKINIATQESMIFAASKQGYSQVAINNDFDRALLKSTDTKSNVKFLLLNNKSESLKEYVYTPENDGYNVELYDDVNDMFIIVTERRDEITTNAKEANGEYVGNGYFLTQIDAIDPITYEKKNLLTSGPSLLEGRGCGNTKAISQKGKLIISASCILIDDRYRDENNNIVVTLSEK